MLFFLTCIMEILEKKRVDEMVCGMFKNKSYFGKKVVSFKKWSFVNILEGKSLINMSGV